MPYKELHYYLPLYQNHQQIRSYYRDLFFHADHYHWSIKNKLTKN